MAKHAELAARPFISEVLVLYTAQRRSCISAPVMTLKSNSDELVTLFGDSGFFGRHVVCALVNRQCRIRVAVRRPELTGHLRPLSRVGQIRAVHVNLRVASSVEGVARDADAVVNLFERCSGVSTPFRRKAPKRWPAPPPPSSFISRPIGADENASCALEGARGAASEHHAASIVFGLEDQFFNRFAALARIFPVLPLPAAANTRFSADLRRRRRQRDRARSRRQSQGWRDARQKQSKGLTQRCWSVLPLSVANLVGPLIRKQLPFI